jgi:hypothetical protein
MDEPEIGYAIGWMMVASGALAVTFSSVFSRHGYKATTAGLLLALLGLLIAGHIWATAVLVMLTFARYAYYLYLRGPPPPPEKDGASDAQSTSTARGIAPQPSRGFPECEGFTASFPSR